MVFPRKVLNPPGVAPKLPRRRATAYFFRRRSSAALAALTALLSLSVARAQAPAPEARSFRLCGLELQVPAGARLAGEGEFDRDGIVLESRVEGGSLRWLYACGYNAGRTSRVSELRPQPDTRAAGSSVEAYEEFHLDQGVLAAVFLRTVVEDGTRRRGVAAYAATRNTEYRMFVVAGEQGAPIAEGEFRLARAALVRQLEDARFVRPVETTITEAEYRLRLYVAAGSVALLLGGGLFWLARRILRGVHRRKRR